MEGHSSAPCGEHEGSLPRGGRFRAAQGNAEARHRWRRWIGWLELDRIDHGDLGVPEGRDLAAPPPAGGEGNQQNSPIADVNRPRSAAGRQESFQNIAGDRLAALALGFTS